MLALISVVMVELLSLILLLLVSSSVNYVGFGNARERERERPPTTIIYHCVGRFCLCLHVYVISSF